MIILAEQKIVNLDDSMTFKDESNEKHGLRGHVAIYRRNKTTGEKSLWYEDDNIIPISGYQWILMKMFGLHLDSDHKNTASGYEKKDQNTNLIIPDLNEESQMSIGTAPEYYSTMRANISDTHIVQGFMIGNGGAGEDQMTAKNTDYSFVCLRNPIPFQQVNHPLSSDVIGKYCGKYRLPSSTVDSYYIKRFDAIPHITHSWWTDGQRWDYIDPVTQQDLGPDSANGTGKTNRIESYVECQLTLDDTDCASFFNTNGNTQTPAINELGLVAFDTTGDGTRTTMENLYETNIKPIIDIIFDSSKRSSDDVKYMEDLIADTVAKMADIVAVVSDKRITNMYNLFKDINDQKYKRSVYQINGMSLVENGGVPNVGGGFIAGEGANAWKYNLFRIKWTPTKLSAGIFALRAESESVSIRGTAATTNTFLTWTSNAFKSEYPITNDQITWFDGSAQSVETESLATGETAAIFAGDFDVEMISPLKTLDGEVTADPEPPQGFQVHVDASDVTEIQINHPWDLYQIILSVGDEAQGEYGPNIGVEALYDRYNNYKRESDSYLDIIKSDAFSALTVDEAQRIKLITYYTFKAIPIQTNWEIVINYRIYAN